MTGRRWDVERFDEELDFLRRHTEVVLLQGSGGEQVVVTPHWQGKTMTSGFAGQEGQGSGWINKPFIASRREDIQANLHGGEDRFWIGPEGGQFAFFFDPGRPFDFSFWRCPQLIDRQAFEVVSSAPSAIELSARGRLRNHRGFEFDMQLGRRVVLLERSDVETGLSERLPDEVSVVGHESANRLRNVGDRDWLPQAGLPCIWNLGMFPPTPRTVMLLPFREGATDAAEPAVSSNYFGPVDERRLKIEAERGVALFSGDGLYRSKLGVGFPRARAYLGSWTPETGRLTLVQFNLPSEIEHGYCCNLWEEQAEPFAGDVVNVYNDGPNESGGCLGPFYELETLSPALGLRVGQEYEHLHRTLHLFGPREALEDFARRWFGISLAEVERKFM